jgi:hypothetical protein
MIENGDRERHAFIIPNVTDVLQVDGFVDVRRSRESRTLYGGGVGVVLKSVKETTIGCIY